MKTIYSVEIDKDNPTALAQCLKRLEYAIPDYEYDWRIIINAGGIDYGIYLNIDVGKKEIEICNQPVYGTDGDDWLDHVIDYFKKKEEV